MKPNSVKIVLAALLRSGAYPVLACSNAFRGGSFEIIISIEGGNGYRCPNNNVKLNGQIIQSGNFNVCKDSKHKRDIGRC